MCSCASCAPFVRSVFAFERPKVVKLHSVSLGFIYRVLCVVVVFLIGYLVYSNNGYQKISLVESAVTTKIHGLVYTNRSELPGLDGRIWDNADFMVPPKENGAFTVITSIKVTPDQRQTTCEEDPCIPDGACEEKLCIAGKAVVGGNGVMTGKCTVPKANLSGCPYTRTSPATKVCEIKAWCPVEIDEPSRRTFIATENFTVIVLNYVNFPELNFKAKNVPEKMEIEELQSCSYDKNKDCPVFKISTIAEEAKQSFDDLKTEGAVIKMIINWDCDLDKLEECLPTYTFTRLDSSEHRPSRGFHLRYNDHYQLKNGTNNASRRTLYRAYGIRVIVAVHGKARKFHFVTTAKSIGSWLSYLALPSFIVGVLIISVCRCFCKQNKCLCEDFCTRWCPIFMVGTGGQQEQNHCCCYYWRCCFVPITDDNNTNTRDLRSTDDDMVAVNFNFQDAFKDCCFSSWREEANQPDRGNQPQQGEPPSDRDRIFALERRVFGPETERQISEAPNNARVAGTGQHLEMNANPANNGAGEGCTPTAEPNSPQSDSVM